MNIVPELVRPVYNNLEEVADSCVAFYQSNAEEMTNSNVRKRRSDLSAFVGSFHRECGTLNSDVQRRINDLRNNDCIVLMTAHQPNLFAYSGVLRKATLIYVLAKRLERRLGVKVVNFFGIADQDFTDDRWVKSSLLPAVSRRDGLMTLQTRLPKERMICKVRKPSTDTINKWKDEIEAWLYNAINSVGRFYKDNGVSEWSSKEAVLQRNFEEFWKMVEEAREQSTTYSDFNAFIMSKIVNETWGYDTLFSRFSECQQIFIPEFGFLLSHFDDYSSSLREAIEKEGERGVSEKEPELAPFWYHCDCGSKVKISLANQGRSLVGYGRCSSCNEEYKLDLGAIDNPDISAIASRISARAIPMTLIFFKGLGVSCYVGGIGGLKYLTESQYAADKLNLSFPPILFWRPHDKYVGIGQLEALLEFKRITGNFKVSNWEEEIEHLKSRIEDVREHIDKLEAQKEKIVERLRRGDGEKTALQEEIRNISINQSKLRKASNFSVLNRDLKILENIPVVLNLVPSIIDYAVNVGLQETSEQWIDFLVKNGSLSSNVHLKSVLDGLMELDSNLFW